MDYTLYGTTYGLALASGINAYFPLLAFAVAARWFHLYKVNPNFSFVTQTWFIALLTVLTLIDLVADKIPLIDHAWDSIHTLIRPVMGALVVAASDNQVHLQSMMPLVPTIRSTLIVGTVATIRTSTNISVKFLGVILIGAILAFMVHITKATTRVASTATTAGLGNIVLSVLEDIGVLIMTLLSLLAPLIMFVLVVIFVLVFVLSLRRIMRLFGRRRSRAFF